MFDEMSFLIKQEVVRTLMHAEVSVDQQENGAGPGVPPPPGRRGGLQYEHADASTLEALAAGTDPGDGEPIDVMPVVEQRQVDPALPGRNDPCWCGSGKKFKRCHGA
jgi:preprotein translocase subunit SecA